LLSDAWFVILHHLVIAFKLNSAQIGERVKQGLYLLALLSVGCGSQVRAIRPDPHPQVIGRSTIAQVGSNHQKINFKLTLSSSHHRLVVLVCRSSRRRLSINETVDDRVTLVSMKNDVHIFLDLTQQREFSLSAHPVVVTLFHRNSQNGRVDLATWLVTDQAIEESPSTYPYGGYNLQQTTEAYLAQNP
jgi:hypothetical protein